MLNLSCQKPRWKIKHACKLIETLYKKISTQAFILIANFAVLQVAVYVLAIQIHLVSLRHHLLNRWIKIRTAKIQNTVRLV